MLGGRIDIALHFLTYRKIMVNQGDVAYRTTLLALQYLNDRFHVKRMKTTGRGGEGPGFHRLSMK